MFISSSKLFWPPPKPYSLCYRLFHYCLEQRKDRVFVHTASLCHGCWHLFYANQSSQHSNEGIARDEGNRQGEPSATWLMNSRQNSETGSLTASCLDERKGEDTSWGKHRLFSSTKIRRQLEGACLGIILSSFSLADHEGKKWQFCILNYKKEQKTVLYKTSFLGEAEEGGGSDKPFSNLKWCFQNMSPIRRLRQKIPKNHIRMISFHLEPENGYQAQRKRKWCALLCRKLRTEIGNDL